MPGEEIEARALPRPVLHDLRGEFDEVPRDIYAIERLDFHFAKEVMEQVPKLVKDRLHLAMLEQRRLALARRCHVAAHQSQMRRPRTICARSARDQIVHPRPSALRLSRIPIGVKRTHVPAARIPHVVEFHFGVPGLHVVSASLDHP